MENSLLVGDFVAVKASKSHITHSFQQAGRNRFNIKQLRTTNFNTLDKVLNLVRDQVLYRHIADTAVDR